MRYRVLGKTGLEVAEVGFGGWAIGGNEHGQSLGPTDDRVSLAALNQAYESGCNLFVTSDLYGRGHSEMLMGEVLQGWKRDEVLIATQGGQMWAEQGDIRPNFSASHLLAAVETSLKRLQVEAIDLYLLQTPPLAVIQQGQIFETLHRLKDDGKIRFSGVSIQDPQEGIQAIERGNVDVLMTSFNLFDARAEKHLFAACLETNTGLLVREPLARGFLSGSMKPEVVFERGDVRAVWPKPLIARRVEAASRFDASRIDDYGSLAQLALAYGLHSEAVASVIPDCQTPEEVRQNLETTKLPSLSAEVLDAIRALQQRL